MRSISHTIIDWLFRWHFLRHPSLRRFSRPDAVMFARMCLQLERQASPILWLCMWVGALAFLPMCACFMFLWFILGMQSTFNTAILLTYITTHTYVVVLAEIVFAFRLYRRIKSETRATLASPTKRLRACPACGYDLTGSPQPLCPECGQNSRLSITRDTPAEPLPLNEPRP